MSDREAIEKDDLDLGFDPSEVRASVNSEDWQESMFDDGQEQRGAFLGTVFALCPSGKYYTPWACSNVDPCPVCNGKGTISQGRMQDLVYDVLRFLQCEIVGQTIRNRDKAPLTIKLLCLLYKTRMRFAPITCAACGGLGSREAYLDDLWHEKADLALGTVDLYLEHGEGDPCDLFATEYRDRENGEGEDWDDDLDW